MVYKLFIIFLIIPICLIGYSQEDDVVQKGQQVPDFFLQDETGQPTNMSQLKGKIVLINFFATWCGPCMAEMPLIQERIWQKYKDIDYFKIVSIGRGHSLDEIIQFKNAKKFDFPLYPDADKIIYNKFASKYIPRNYIINANGEIVYMSQGFSPEEFDHMLTILERLIRKQIKL